MASGLSERERKKFYVEADIKPRRLLPRPGTAEYEASLDGMEPTVQLFGEGTQEEKLAPNYSDWLQAHTA